MDARTLLWEVPPGSDVGELEPELCWEVLESTELGRLAIATLHGVDIFPVNFAVDGTKIYFRTGPGDKLAAIDANPHVALEVDGVDPGVAAFSVVVKGKAERLEAPVDIDAAEALSLTPWTTTLKLRWVRIRPSEVSGRVFRLGTEPYPLV